MTAFHDECQRLAAEILERAKRMQPVGSNARDVFPDAIEVEGREVQAIEGEL